MKQIIIPTKFGYPTVDIVINEKKYTLKSGTPINVNDAVAAVIENAIALEPKMGMKSSVMYHHKMKIYMSNGITIYDNHYSSSSEPHSLEEWATSCGLQGIVNAMHPCVYVDSNNGKIENTAIIRFDTSNGASNPTCLMIMNGDVNPVQATVTNFEDTVMPL